MARHVGCGQRSRPGRDASPPFILTDRRLESRLSQMPMPILGSHVHLEDAHLVRMILAGGNRTDAMTQMRDIITHW